MKVFGAFALVGGLLLALPGFAAKGDEPCRKVLKACEGAGFVKGHHKEKKGLFKDCFQPLMEGSAVAGVSAAPEDVTACKEKRARHHRG